MTTNTPVLCPHCQKQCPVLDGDEDATVTVVCADCNKSYSIDFKANKVSKYPEKTPFEDIPSDIPLERKIRCPHGCKTAILYLIPAETIISVKCSQCGNYYRANLKTGRAWLTKAQKRA